MKQSHDIQVWENGVIPTVLAEKVCILPRLSRVRYNTDDTVFSPYSSKALTVSWDLSFKLLSCTQ